MNNSEFNYNNLKTSVQNTNFYYAQHIIDEKQTDIIGIKSVANKVCMAMMSFLVLPSLIMLLLMFFSSIDVNSLLTNSYSANPLNAVLMVLFIGVPFFIVWILTGKKQIPLNKPKSGGWAFVWVGLGVAVLSNLATNFILFLVSTTGYDVNSVNVMMESNNPLWDFVVGAFCTALMPALIEEFAFRGVVLNALKKYGQGFAVIISSMLFALLHGNVIQIPFALGMGFILGIVALKTGSLWICVLIHFLNNFMAVFFQYIPSVFGDDVMNVSYLMWSILCCIMGLVCLVYLIKNKPEMLKFEKCTSVLTINQRMKAFMTTISFVIFAVIIVCLVVVLPVISMWTA